MPRLRWFRVLAAVALSIVAGCSAPAPPPGPPPASAVALYTLAESNRGKPQDIRHGEPVDVGWHAASGTFLVATYNDGTIYRGRLADPDVPVYMKARWARRSPGSPSRATCSTRPGSISGQIRVYDLATKAQVGRFETGSGGEVIDLAVTSSGDVWATDGVRPVLWHLTAQQVADGSGTPTALPVAPEIAFTPGPNNLSGIVAVSDRRLLVVHEGDGTLYRIDLDPQAPRGRTITRIDGATVRQGEGMVLDGNRLVVADFHGLSIVDLSDDAGRATAVTPIRDPAFDATSRWPGRRPLPGRQLVHGRRPAVRPRKRPGRRLTVRWPHAARRPGRPAHGADAAARAVGSRAGPAGRGGRPGSCWPGRCWSRT